ncbi:MAG: competence/damage-inducible protein A [Lentimicrobiaceae bacterium]|nr:competence/damage-inducible protein A [Lentimicrobiaceae bacterium]
MKKAEIITIGDELLIGQVINTNAAWIAAELNAIGIEVIRMTSVGDVLTDMLDAMKEASARADLILMTGGLGPTKDDITKTALCDFFGARMRFNETVFQQVQALLQQRGFPMRDSSRSQAFVPEGCRPVQNSVGTAPGMWFEKTDRIYIVMPGVPFEMKAMMTDHILPCLKARFKGDFILHKTILTTGAGESQISEMVSSWESALPPSIRLAYLPQPGLVRLRLSARGTDPGELQNAVADQVQRLQRIIPDLIFGYDDDSLEGVIGKRLAEIHQTLATAESCTGGYIAHLITGIPGSSQYYVGSIISYANSVKELELGVRPESLHQFGAVSEQVVTQMALGIRERFGVDYAIATSGIAGPDGGTPEKPVGTVWLAVASPAGTVAQKFFFNDDRQRFIHRTSLAALNMLRREIG